MKFISIGFTLGSFPTTTYVCQGCLPNRTNLTFSPRYYVLQFLGEYYLQRMLGVQKIANGH
jgi:hypothetical protein